MTNKENTLRAIRHDSPEWVPNDMESLVMVRSPVIERPGKAGKDAFGVDWSLEKGAEGVTPDEVRAEVRMRIDELATGGGYIAGPSHSVPYDKELLDAMNDEIETYGRKIYAR